jgi:hypothetical protein
VNVANRAKAIDAGKLAAALSGALGGIYGNRDTMTVTASFQNVADKRLGGKKIGPVTEKNRENKLKQFPGVKYPTMLLDRSSTTTVPKGTRSIAVTLRANKVDGAFCDAIADNVSLALAPVKGR